MTRDQIIQTIVEYINLQLNGQMGEIYEDPYRGAFFALFVEAHTHGLIANKSLTTGALLGTLQHQWDMDSEGKNIDRLDFVEDLLLYWHAWEYAWEQYEKRYAVVLI